MLCPEATRNQQQPSTAHQQYRPNKFSGAETFQGAVVKEEGHPPPSDPPPPGSKPPTPGPPLLQCVSGGTASHPPLTARRSAPSHSPLISSGPSHLPIGSPPPPPCLPLCPPPPHSPFARPGPAIGRGEQDKGPEYTNALTPPPSTPGGSLPGGGWQPPGTTCSLDGRQGPVEHSLIHDHLLHTAFQSALQCRGPLKRGPRRTPMQTRPPCPHTPPPPPG